MSDMNATQIARRLAELGQSQDACNAYMLAVNQGAEPAEKLEAALYMLQFGEDYKIPYTWLRELYDIPECQEDVLNIMTEAFYLPNEKQMKTRYEKNCRLLQKYPYISRKDFPKFEELPIRFFPYDDNGYLPFYKKKGNFDIYFNPRNQVITHHFFKDLENPILAHDIFSQYELEYLWDNVRASEDIGRENHIYLHYSEWEVFCAYLQVLNFNTLLKRNKIVFLMGDEVAKYPIDFKEQYGIDYSRYPIKPPVFTEYTKLIWHTQLSSDNGGDFFNEVMDNHPNLMLLHSHMLSDVKLWMENFQLKKEVFSWHIPKKFGEKDKSTKSWLVSGLTRAELMSAKGKLIAFFLSFGDMSGLDIHSRITPTIFFQPHFNRNDYSLTINSKNQTELWSEPYEQIQNFAPFKQFKYIKTFSPLRRITTSGAAEIRYGLTQQHVVIGEKIITYIVLSDALIERIMNQSFMVDWQDRLFKDSVLVRFEDGKTNPKATFTALAKFLDIPYTETMTYCSMTGKKDPESFPGNAIGFSKEICYRTYDEFLGKEERYLIEYFLREAYKRYGYDFHYYDGAPMDAEKVEEIIDQIHVINTLEKNYDTTSAREYNALIQTPEIIKKFGELSPIDVEKRITEIQARNRKIRVRNLSVLLKNLTFVNKKGQPLHFMPMLQPDPDLLVEPLYH